jgi:O-antigen/teichoic acid export membrane protein
VSISRGSLIARGTVYLMIAQLLFVISGYVIHFGLGRFLGPEEYGLFGIILSLITIIEVILIRGVRDAISKYVAEYEDCARSILKSGLKIELMLSLTAFCFIIYFSEHVATLLGDIRLMYYIRLAAIIIPLVSIYSVYIGYLSGKREFGKQAISMGVQSIGKVFGVYLFILLLGLGTSGAIVGYALGSASALITARYLSMKNKIFAYNNFPSIKLVTFAVPLVIFSIAISAIMNMDLLFVKALTEDGIKTGYYASASTITRAPFYIFIALSFTLLPAISKAVSSNDYPRIQEYIKKSLRYLAMMLIPMTLFISSTSIKIIELTYSREYLPASDTVSILIFGITFITIFYTLCMILIGSGNSKVPTTMSCILVIIDIILFTCFIPKFGLEGAAIATTLTGFIGLMIIGMYVKMKYRVLMNCSSFLKIVLSSLPLYLIPHFFVVSGSYFIFYALFMSILYASFLLILKELTNEDFELLFHIFRHRR